MRILLVEDHETVSANIRQYLELQKYRVMVAGDGTTGLTLAMTEPFDLVILDINLPGMDGYEICRALRGYGKTMPILMLTARSLRTEEVHGLNLGADDYLPKPFDLDVLLARVRALLRRQTTERSPVLTVADCTIDTNAQQCRRDGTLVSLSPREYALLEFLLRHRGTAQSRQAILEHVWGERDVLLLSNTVDVHVGCLRRKIGKNTIRTVSGFGYIIDAP